MLSIIEPERTFSFEVNFDCQDLVRTGVIGDGNCFFHAVLRATDPGYKRLTTDEKIKAVEQMRSTISKSITQSLYRNLGNGSVMRLGFFQQLLGLLQDFAQETPLIDMEMYEKEILPKAQSGENFYTCFWEVCLKHLEKTILPKLTQDQFVNVCKRLSSQYIEIFNRAHEQGYQKFISEIAIPGTMIGSVHIEAISKVLRRNFLFIDGKTLDAYPQVSNFDVEQKTIILLWVGENHYEVVGKLLPGNTIQRVFSTDDDIVQLLTIEE
jgi:hypothetical protein